MSQQSAEILSKPEVEKWLEECRKPSTRRIYKSSIKRFFKWYPGTYEEFIGLDPKELHHVLRTFISQNSSENPNTIGGVVARVNAFLLYLDKPVVFRRGERPRPQPDVDSHVFSNGDLSRMFDVASTKEKALLALMVSLGWEISAVLELDPELLRALVARAKAEGEQFIYWRSIRQKTGVPRLGVLNPLALEWLDKWLVESRGAKKRKRKADKKTADRPVSALFDLGAEGVNKMLRRLAKDAGIVVTGRLHVHKIRGWVMSGLSRAGWNEFQIKFLVGKAIPLRDSTYLQTLELEIREKYPKAYAEYMNIKPERIVKVVDEETRRKAAEVDTLQREIKELRQMFQGTIDEVKRQLQSRGASE
jgi:site-specific recombinase XerD